MSLVGVFDVPVMSQSSSDILVSGSFFRTNTFQWSSDSSKLVFYNYELGSSKEPLTVVAGSAGWQSIDVPTGNQSSGTNIWPLQPMLSTDEQNNMMSLEFVQQSPDGNLLLFAQAPGDMGFFPLAIANRSTGQVASLNLETTVYPFNPSLFEVQWSADSHAAIVAYGLGSGELRVLHVTIPDFTDLQNTTIREFDTVIDGLPYSTTPEIEDDILDISLDGQFVLLIARDTTVYETSPTFYNPPELVIWNPYTNHADIVTTNIMIEQFLKGSFAPSDDTRLLLANSQGLFVHDLGANRTQLLRNDFDTVNARYYFSPDANWLAVVEDELIRFISIGSLLTPESLP
jgi:hypothetical protein